MKAKLQLTIPQQLDAQAMMLRCETIEASKEFIEKSHEFLGSALIRKRSESANVGKQNAHVFVALDVDLVEKSNCKS